MKVINLIVAASSLLASCAVWAHPGHDTTASFAHGFMHPLTGADHLLALLLIGMFAAPYGWKTASKAIGVVLGALAVGFVVGIEWVNTSHIETVVMASLVLLPLALIAMRRSALQALALAAVALFSACHGIVQGAESQGALLQYALGTLLASGVVIVASLMASKAVSRAVFATRQLSRR